MLLTKGGFSRIINIVVREQTKTKNKICGCSSSGRAPPCQGGGSEFEPRHPLQVLRQSRNRLSFFCCVCKSGIENPRRFRLRGFSFVLTEQTYIFKCEQHTYMRIATLLLDRWIYLPTLATRTHMRIATSENTDAGKSQRLATRTHMRIATSSPHRLFFIVVWQPALTCVLQHSLSRWLLPARSGNPHSHAYCNGKNAQYYNTQSS